MPDELPSSNPARVIERAADVAEEPNAASNNVGSGSDVFDLNQLAHVLQDIGITDAIERSNRLAEQANQLARRSNQLIEKSNQIAEHSNQLIEWSSQPAEQSNKLFKKFNELFERLNQHLEESNSLAEESTKPTERLGDVMENINRVLVKIQHAIVRSHKGNTKNALDCLVNDRGEVPCVSDTIGGWDLKSLSEYPDNEAAKRISILIDDEEHKLRFPDHMLGHFLCFYGWGGFVQKRNRQQVESWDDRHSTGEATDILELMSCDDEVVRIHTVLHAANRVSGVPGMHDPTFLMSLADHLFSVQMARYRNRYSLITFPSDATYTPPVLPAHISINLEPVSGAPSDDQLTRVQDAIQTYQELRRIPSMFDAHINMELSQHFFDLQMARHMRVAAESQSSPISQTITGPRDPAPTLKSTSETTEVPTIATNNAGTGGNASVTYLTTQPASDINVGDLIQRSNQLSERSNSYWSAPINYWNKAVFERLAGLTEQFHQPVEQSDRITERFSQLLERFNQLLEQSNQPAHEANKLAERSNELANRANELAEKLNQSHEQSNQLAKQANKPFENLGELLGNINRVLVGIQHAIVRVGL
ncbi:hypothetical protein RSOLAG22IIIB_08501 [Rhizoctonia solani]|uniref:Uncharacterized protein n=1 Tax=Rhizoctonia solani TaxID=456999 RepID=A0A0K6FTM9_9AGAM|nr:hypothetical protein RSOLAG22IIIB_08501 [Rhizoctonia solani]